jgi:hypothetical protein
VEARDGGRPRRTANTTLTLRVLDVNDNGPNCSSVAQPMVVTIGKRGQPGVGPPLARIQIRDPDEGENGTVRVRLQSPHAFFELTPNGHTLFSKNKIIKDCIKIIFSSLSNIISNFYNFSTTLFSFFRQPVAGQPIPGRSCLHVLLLLLLVIVDVITGPSDPSSSSSRPSPSGCGGRGPGPGPVHPVSGL